MLPPEVRAARLTPEGVRYGSDDDRRLAFERARRTALHLAAREPIRLELDELSDFPSLLGGRAARPTQPVILYFPGGQKVVAVGGFGRLEAAEIQETLYRKAEERTPQPKRKKAGPAGDLLIARKMAPALGGKRR